MGQRTFVVKSGFFSRQKTITECFCDGCGKTFYGLESWKSVDGNDFCHKCVFIAAPDRSHDWPEPGQFQKFFTDTATAEEVCVLSCTACCSVKVAIQTATGIESRYFHVGARIPVPTPAGCTPHAGYDENGNVRAHQACVHDFISVATSKVVGDSAHEKFRHFLAHRNTDIEVMYGVDTLEYQYWAYGSTHYWCARCGLHYNLNPQREHLLPIMGQIRRSD